MDTNNHQRRLGKGFVVSWWIAFVMAAPLAARLLYERTILAWRDGEQAVGFTLAHRNPEIVFFGLAGCVALAAWFLVALVSLIVRRKAPSRDIIAYLLAAPLLVLICAPVL